jgi:hypothetical protein
VVLVAPSHATPIGDTNTPGRTVTYTGEPVTVSFK